MKQLPEQPQNANERALAQEYREEFTGKTGTTLSLTYEPMRTADSKGLELVYLNGRLLCATAFSASSSTSTWYRERRTGSTSATWVLGHTPDAGLELVHKNGVLLDPSSEYSISTATITLGSAPINTDVLIAFYPNSSSTSSSAGTSYTISGKTLTFDRALVSADVVLVFYPYRTN